MVDLKVRLEALSALSGCRVEGTGVGSLLGPQDLVNIVALREFYRQEGFKQLDYPSLGTLSLDDTDDSDLYGSPPALAEGPDTGTGTRTTVRINPLEFFDGNYDYDFTKVKDGEARFTRGNEPYLRPCGWNRVALKVLKKFDDGDGWLGTGSSAWPVSYHGKNMDGSLGVILTRGQTPDDDPKFLEAAASALVGEGTRGRGVYSTPDIKIAEKFCKTFKSQADGRTYKVILQNRINPSKRIQCQRDGIWLVYVPDGSTDAEKRAIVQESLRPYGLLLKRV
ncbi:uncharacterized protein LOC130128898 [Lampris incognitus]|uniref:uncharacterized protein LOC130128898 n=1 Tax=Lampris incognitus TaxID=2546036 RepID=UPI0024B5F8FB|nr:uncharacterized protein LOC130128898 [Lampris incognitus]